MPYVPHVRITMSGTLGSGATGVEIFSTGFAIASPMSAGGQWGLPTATEQDAIITAIRSMWSGTSAGISSSASLLEVRFAAIKQDGKVSMRDDGAYMQDKRPQVQLRGGGGVPNHPFQVAQVVTLETARAGATGRGRMYLPTPTPVVDGEGLVAPTVATATATALKTLFDGVNAAMRAGGSPSPQRVVVASQGSIKQGQVPVNTPVTGVRVGRVLDTIRTRRNNLAEGYLRTTLAA